MKDRLLDVDMTKALVTDIQIRFADYDTFGHVNNNAYMAYFDLGKTHLFQHLMGHRCSPAELSAVIVNVNVDFLAPAVIDESLDVRTVVKELHEKSFVVYQRVTNPQSGVVKAQATTVLAGFDIATQSGAPLRPELVDILSKFCR